MIDNIKEDNDKNFANFDMSYQYSDIFEGKQKKIDCTYELIFNITAHLMKQNDNGEDMSAEQVCAKNYHIPVKEGSDTKIFMDTFFKFLENCLANSAKNAYENSKESNNG